MKSLVDERVERLQAELRRAADHIARQEIEHQVLKDKIRELQRENAILIRETLWYEERLAGLE